MSVPRLHSWARGSGRPVLLIHETGATARVWEPLAAALERSARVIAYDRPGWGESPAPESYERTTVGEQATHALAVLEEHGHGEPAVACGAGLGGVVALELLANHRDRVAGAVAIEPPLFAFVRAATEQLSVDVEAMRDAAQRSGRRAVLELHATGGLLGLGAGAERLPAEARDEGPGAPTALIAELGAVPAWQPPLAALAGAPQPVAIVTATATPPILEQAALGLAAALPRARASRFDSPGLPHREGAPSLADLILSLEAHA